MNVGKEIPTSQFDEVEIGRIFKSIQRARFWRDFRFGMLLGFLVIPIIIVFLTLLF